MKNSSEIRAGLEQLVKDSSLAYVLNELLFVASKRITPLGFGCILMQEKGRQLYDTFRYLENSK